MRSFAVLAAAVGLASAHGGSWGTGAPVYVTDVVTAYTTYCPSATMISHNGVTYTVTEATTLTISNCPCTVTRPVSSASATPVVTKPASTGAPKASSYFPSVAAASSTTASAPAATYTGAAAKAQVAGAGLLAVLGAAAIAL